MEIQNVPKVQKIAEVGSNPFQYLSTTEKILQGWNSTTRKTVFLFKTDTGWGYFDKPTGQVIDVNQWKGKAVFIGGQWIKMTLYYRIHVAFAEPVSLLVWNKEIKKKEQIAPKEVLITLTGSAYKQLEEQMRGRPPGSWYQLSFTTRKKPNGPGNMTYVDKVLWIS